MSEHINKEPSEEEIREAVKRYVRAEMDILDKMDFIKEPLPDSERYKRRIRRVFRKHGFPPPESMAASKGRYRVAIASVAACLCLLLAVAAGAKFLGILPGQSQSGTEVARQETTGDSDNAKKRVSDEPLYVSDGLKETGRVESNTFLDVEWLADEESGIQYSRDAISEGTGFPVNNAFDFEEKVAVAGYMGTYREQKEGTQNSITWNDNIYSNTLSVSNMSVSKEELLKMAESMYDMMNISDQESDQTDVPSVVFHNGQFEKGKENWDSFVQDSQNGKACKIHLIKQYDDADKNDANEEEPNFSNESVADAHTCEDSYLEFDGKTYCYSCKHVKRNYKYLLKRTGRYYKSVKDTTWIVLSNEKYSFIQLEKSVLSSNSEDDIPYKIIFLY